MRDLAAQGRSAGGRRGWMRRAFLFPLLLLATACSATPKVEVDYDDKDDGPALWKVADKDTTIYLFGTIHALPADAKWRDKRINAAITLSNQLYLETVIDAPGVNTLQLLLDLGQRLDLPPLLDRVPADKRAVFADAIKRSGYPPALFDQLETWAAGFVLTGVAIKDMGLQPGIGVEEQLTDTFHARGKPVDGLETVRQQLGYFDGLPEEDQRRFLADTIEDPKQSRKEFDAMFDAWQHGDEDKIEATFDEEMRETPRLKQVLLVERNRRWADWVKARLGQPGIVFVAVGAGHLAGPQSVVAMLKSAGEPVVRVR